MFHINQQIGNYKLISRIGSDYFGAIWVAETQSRFLTKKVVVRLPPKDENFNFEMIRSFAGLCGRVGCHSNILSIIDADVYDGQVLIVSEYAAGGSLSDHLRAHGKLALRQALEITIGILDGLDFLHRQKIVHRDLQPQNILFQNDFPRLEIFGFLQLLEKPELPPDETELYSAAGIHFGPGSYMAPETFDEKLTVQSNIWSVGVIFYQLLSGTFPFPKGDMVAMISAIISSEFLPLPDEITTGLNKRILTKILNSALAKKMSHRYQTAAAMRDDLQEALFDLKNPYFNLNIPCPG